MYDLLDTDEFYFSYEEQCFKQIERLREQVVRDELQSKLDNAALGTSNRLYRHNIFEAIAPHKNQELEKQLVKMLRLIGNHINQHFLDVNSAWSPICSPTTGEQILPRQIAGKPLRLVDRRRKSNFKYGRDGSIHLKPAKEVLYQSTQKKRSGLILHIVAKVLRLIETDSYMTKRELYYKSLDFCRVDQRRSIPSQSQSTQGSGRCASNSQALSQRTNANSQGRQSQSMLSQANSQNGSQRISLSQSSVMDHQTQRYSTAKLDLALKDLCCFVGCSLVHLHILTQSKGIVYGNLQFKTRNGESYDCLKNEGLMIPTAQSPIIEMKSDAKFVIVIEKDAVMQKIISRESTICFVKNYKAILFTAKGYPDVNSRAFLNHLWTNLQIPILALTDADPQGLEIVCCYKFGCYQSAHEASHLIIPHIKWLGLLPYEMMQMNLPDSQTKPLSRIDDSKIDSLLARPYLKSRETWYEQIKLMRSLGKKAELESLDFSGDYLVTTYLPDKIRKASWL